MKKLSIVVPVYYNEASLSFLFTELLELERELSQREMELELIFVDDGSGDASLAELLKIKQQRPETRVIKLTRNFGAPHASKTGFTFVTGDCFMTLAADLQEPPRIILQMIDRWREGHKFVVCERMGRHDPISARFFSAIYYWLLRLLVVRDFPQRGYDWALMDRVMLPHLTGSSKNINTPLLAYWLGFKPEFIQYRREERKHGKSRWSLGKRLKYFSDSILGFSIIPIRMISFIGLVVSLLSFGYGLLVVIGGFLGRTGVPGFATIVALISFLVGLVIIMLGIIAEYLWRIFEEVNGRPESVIDEVY